MICIIQTFRNVCVFKDDVHSVLRISSAHNKGDIEHCPNFASFEQFFELKCTVYIHLQVKRTRKVLDIQLVYHILQI
jgi:hypothetical protein